MYVVCIFLPHMYIYPADIIMRFYYLFVWLVCSMWYAECGMQSLEGDY